MNMCIVLSTDKIDIDVNFKSRKDLDIYMEDLYIKRIVNDYIIEPFDIYVKEHFDGLLDYNKYKYHYKTVIK